MGSEAERIICGNCDHVMSGEVYRNVMRLDASVPDERIHIRLDESCPELQCYGCICGHFTLIGTARQMEAYLKSRRKHLRGS